MHTDSTQGLLADPWLRRQLWRLHGLAALLATPFIALALLTGLAYLPTPQVEAWLHAGLDRAPAHTRHLPALPLDRAVEAGEAAARTLHPGARLRAVRPPAKAGDSVQLRLELAPRTAGAAKPGPWLVFVDPASAEVLGQQDAAARYGAWTSRLHSQLRQGDTWRWMAEWAASAMFVMLASGALLAWPLRHQPADKRLAAQHPTPPAPNPAAPRSRWHRRIGWTALALSSIIVLTGLTWSQTAGQQIRTARDALGQATPRVDAQALSPRSPTAAPPMSWQEAWEHARAAAPGVALQISAPRHRAEGLGVWLVTTPDASQPLERAELTLDASTGQVLQAVRWADLTAFAQLTALGIPFHRGEYGGWNQALVLAFALGAFASLVTGWRLWWRRRPTLRRALPSPGGQAVQHMRMASLGVMLALTALSAALAPLSLSLFAALLLLKLCRPVLHRTAGQPQPTPPPRKPIQTAP